MTSGTGTGTIRGTGTRTWVRNHPKLPIMPQTPTLPSSTTNKLQLILTQEQYDRVEREAERRGATKAQVCRDAIVVYFDKLDRDYARGAA